jgi:hypothetical protein
MFVLVLSKGNELCTNPILVILLACTHLVFKLNQDPRSVFGSRIWRKEGKWKGTRELSPPLSISEDFSRMYIHTYIVNIYWLLLLGSLVGSDRSHSVLYACSRYSFELGRILSSTFQWLHPTSYIRYPQTYVVCMYVPYCF